MTEPVNINAVPKLNLGLQETDEVFITRGGAGPYRVPASSFPWERKGDPGAPGGSWAPVLSLVTDGVRRVHRIVGWVGGTGVEPTTMGYIGAAGIVSNVAEAVDVRGLQGNAGWAPVLALVADGDRRVHQVIDWTGGAGAKPGVGWYVGVSGLVELIQDAVNVRGATGGVGWSPVLAVVPDGNRRVQQIVDWIGGAGTKPTALGYIGTSGIVATAALAADVSGAQGNAGWAPVLAIVAHGERRVQQVVDWTGGAGTKPETLGYIGTAGIVATAAAAVDVRGAQGSAGWAPVLAIVADGERRVQQVVDWMGGEGNRPETRGYIGTAGIVATAAAAVDVRGPLGAVSAESVLDALTLAQPAVRVEIGALVSRGRRNWPNRENKIYFDGRDLGAYTAKALTAGGGSVTVADDGSITEAMDLTNGNTGGTILTLLKGANANKNVMVTPYFMPPVLDELSSWFFTEEIKVPSGGWCTYAFQNEALANLIFMTVGLPDGQVKVQPTGGAALTVTKAVSGFEMTDWCRLLVVVTPTSAGAGDVRTYVYSSAGRFFAGKTSYVSNNFPTRVRFEQKNNGSNTMYKARQVVGRVSGVLVGCSLEAGYFGWNMAPSISRATNNYQTYRNPANLFAAMYGGTSATLHGAADWIINAAVGGYTVAQMLADYQAWVLDVKPSFVLLGSATNSVMSALSAPNATAYMTQAKADYRSMIDQAKALGIAVFVTGITPRHEALVLSLGIEQFISLAKDWNSWLGTQGVPCYDPWEDFEDPAIPGQLSPIFDGGDHLHFNKFAQRNMALRQYEAWFGT